MSKNHFELPDKPDDPVPKVIDNMGGTTMWEVSLAAPEGECNIGPTCNGEAMLLDCGVTLYSYRPEIHGFPSLPVENTTYV